MVIPSKILIYDAHNRNFLQHKLKYMHRFNNSKETCILSFQLHFDAEA